MKELDIFFYPIQNQTQALKYESVLHKYIMNDSNEYIACTVFFCLTILGLIFVFTGDTPNKYNSSIKLAVKI